MVVVAHAAGGCGAPAIADAVFDVCGVLIDWQPTRALEGAFPTQEARDFTSMGDHARDGLARLGAPLASATAVARRLAARPECALADFPMADDDRTLMGIGPAASPRPHRSRRTRRSPSSCTLETI